MKLNEFKAWFEGFTEIMDGAPSAKQWKRIKERVAEIDGVAVTYPIYVERYWPSYLPQYAPVYPSFPIWNAVGVGSSSAGMDGYNTSSACVDIAAFDGATAMFAAGKAEARSL